MSMHNTSNKHGTGQSQPSCPISIGTTVRAFRNQKYGEKTATSTGRAIVATIYKRDDDILCSLIWLDSSPVPLSRDVKFKVTPMLLTDAKSKSRNEEEEEEEDGVLLSSLSSLLPFELPSNAAILPQAASSSFEVLCNTINRYKDQGDTLLRLKDSSAALEHYEMALSTTSTISVGGTVIVKIGGHAVLADIDCVDGDEMDVTYFTTEKEEKECTLHQSKVLLAIFEQKQKDQSDMQERLLLNMARCLLMLAEQLDNHEKKDRYLNSAVLACTLSLSCSSYHNPEQEQSPASMSRVEKARYLRARAYFSMGNKKLKHAQSDLFYILKNVNPDNKAAAQLIRDIQRRQAKAKKTDKKLAKEMCGWVKDATSNTDSLVSDDEKDVPSGSGNISGDVPNVSSGEKEKQKGKEHSDIKNIFLSFVIAYAFLLFYAFLYNTSWHDTFSSSY